MPESAAFGILGGVLLPFGEYQEEFRAAQWAIPGQESWKLERRQHFREAGFDPLVCGDRRVDRLPAVGPVGALLPHMRRLNPTSWA